MRLIRVSLLLLASALLLSADLVRDVRAAIAQGDFARGEQLIASEKASGGETPETILALSWLGRGALAAKNYDAADEYAARTRELALAALATRPLDAEPRLPLALGASIEVQGHVLAGTGRLSEAIAFLNQEIKTHWDTSIRTRIQKNIHLLSLEGKPAPALEAGRHLGSKPPKLAELRGRTVLLFLWAHWCGDCRAQGPVLKQLLERYRDRGLTVFATTQYYGYTARGQDAAPAQEHEYIEGIWRERYADLSELGVPVSEENFKNYGVSTTPTLVLIDRDGIVRMYHPGKMTYEELARIVDRVLAT